MLAIQLEMQYKGHRTTRLSDGDGADMVWIAGGTFRMGSDQFYVEERPVHEVAVTGFWIDRHPVTDEQFARFVAETGYLTVAERPLNPEDFPGAPVENLVPGSMVFHRTKGPVDLRNYTNCWRWTPGAAGGVRMAHPTYSAVWSSIRWFTLLMRTRRPMRNGPERNCPPKQNGNMPREAASRERSSRGAMTIFLTERPWPIRGRASFPGKTTSSTVMFVRHCRK